MFGWELPPNNSGGLGTACLGLTEALAPLDVGLRFVVPKVFEPLPYSHMEVLSAVDYGAPCPLEMLSDLSDEQRQLLTNSLAYGDKIVIDEAHRLHVEHGTGPAIAPHIQAAWYAHQAETIASHVSHFDIIHCHDWMTYYGGLAAQQVAEERGEHVPMVAHVHSTEFDRSGKAGDPAIIAIEQEGLRRANRVVAVSQYTKEIVHREYGVPREKISVVYNGIPAQRQPQRFDLHELKKHHKIVLFMGRVTMQKGPDYFVKLAKAVTENDPSVRFVMVGSGDMEKRCIEEAARNGLTGKILFSSFLRGADVDRAYQLADLFVMPSVSEPFGIVALEAIQNGTPALVSKQSGVAEVSENFIKVDFWDIDKMRDAVLQTLHNPDYAGQLRNGGFRDLLNLSWDNSAAQLRSLYQQLLIAHA